MFFWRPVRLVSKRTPPLARKILPSFERITSLSLADAFAKSGIVAFASWLRKLFSRWDALPAIVRSPETEGDSGSSRKSAGDGYDSRPP